MACGQRLWGHYHPSFPFHPHMHGGASIYFLSANRCTAPCLNLFFIFLYADKTDSLYRLYCTLFKTFYTRSCMQTVHTVPYCLYSTLFTYYLLQYMVADTPAGLSAKILYRNEPPCSKGRHISSGLRRVHLRVVVPKGSRLAAPAIFPTIALSHLQSLFVLKFFFFMSRFSRAP